MVFREFLYLVLAILNFLYICEELTCFANDQLTQMVYTIEDENTNVATVIADTITAVGPATYTARMKQTNFLLKRFPVVANVDYWEFVGWLLTLRI